MILLSDNLTLDKNNRDRLLIKRTRINSLIFGPTILESFSSNILKTKKPPVIDAGGPSFGYSSKFPLIITSIKRCFTIPQHNIESYCLFLYLLPAQEPKSKL